MVARGALLRIGLVGTFVLAEWIAIRRRGRGSWSGRESAASAVIAFGQPAAGLVASHAWGGLFAWTWNHRLATIPVHGIAGIAALWFAVEFAYYWMHRASHTVRWFWASHAVHHSSAFINLSAAYRLGWTAGLTGSGLFMLPLAWVGFAPASIFAMLAAGLFYQFFLHTEQVARLGPLEWVLNTPSHHRVHHGSEPDCLDANFGATTILFDRLFGTFVAERDDRSLRFGLVTPVASRNPLRIAFHEWLRMGADLRGCRSARGALGLLFGPPGWSPTGTGNTTRELRARAAIDG
jgi:sterol desaturase/sphingolipid hydroxylase (fatty acid hydroxylase superfamily)